MKESKILRRQRVEEDLDNLTNYPLTIVSATMGYGKTTSVRTYLTARDLRTIWIPLLGCDGDEMIFWNKLSMSVGRLYPEFGKHLERLGFPIDVRQTVAIIDLFWNLKNEAPLVLVIDDYHLINQSTQLGTLIELLAEEEIPNLHILLLTRTRPKFNHMNLISKGLCYYLDTDSLSFTMQEIKEYLDLMGFCALPQDIEKIYSYTEGWISAVYLLMLGIKKGLPLTEVSNITQLVSDNLFSTFDDSVKEVLLKLSILDTFTLPQAVQILKNPKIPPIIERLLAQNAFVEYDGKTGVYKLHNVLLDFLRDKVIKDNIDMRMVYHCAGKWFFEQGETISAFDYYYRAEQLEELLNRINKIKNIGSWFIGVHLLKKIYQELPSGWYVKYPFPMLHFARSFVLSGEKTQAEESVKIITVLENHYSHTEKISEKLRNRILGEINIVKIFLVVNDADKMVKLSQIAEKLLGAGEVSTVVLRNDIFTFGIPHFLYSYYREAGKLKETVDYVQAGFPPKVFDGCGTGCEFVAQAEYALEIGDFQNAEMFAKKATYKAKTMGQTSIILCAYFTIMRLCLLQGNFSDAKEQVAIMRKFLLDLEEKINLQDTIIYNATIDMCEGYLYGYLNFPDLIPEWLRSGDIGSRTLMLRGMGYPYIIYGKAIMLTKNWIELEILSESFDAGFSVFHNQLSLLYNSIYSATAKYNLYGMEAGINAILPALFEAQSDGIMIPFAENAESVLPILNELKKSEKLDQCYLEGLIRLCERCNENLKSSQGCMVELTNREIEVLYLLAQGLTQREMAQRLYLSVSSIKKHLENIYGKLNVNNKIRAVQKAQELNILKN
ncbi:HTH-type transcriptional regulator MalT [Anaerotignum neopropionicum]|uniref:HTH-type transcriptional regulator MalT n=1 Tax=Anaerotignum neopropionicum TaxID=36847 RepID=A0A136WI96_9FIRM|nr:LuxR C-terminal-related transcriptional regulator [Anaerotignum neopropionicum]KXL54163.1 HTH-type transcriptional regulator MalT [Anaerotignum neopropionicum]KXL54288.1 HTH-type transcriptional regulator MalT [Anaerotignum neopropionicum]